ncbi:MAG: tyrosine-type recombinase/integrase [Burkholderiaceae bacterium]|nr:tyrosine-type recombinase/integrase [Burkholderiaceae bacterium]
MAIHLLEPRQVLAADADLQDGGGLLLRIGGNRAAWVLRYTAPSGRRREMGLGPCPRESLALAGQSLRQAREDARRADDLLRQGVDPLDERERIKREAAEAAAEVKATEQAQQARASLTLARCARSYHERVIEPSRTTKHSAQWIASLQNHMPPELWDAPIDSITAPALLRGLLTIKPHKRARNLKGDTLPETLRRIRQRLDAIFEDAIFHGHCSANPAAVIRRKLREEGPQRATGKLAALPYAEVPALMAKLRTVPGTAARALELAVLTVARTSEVLEAPWEEFDLQAGVWRVSAERMKAGEEHVVHLPPRAVEILQAQVGQDARLVFPSPMRKPDGTVRPLSNMAMLVTLGRMGMRERTTVHGLCRASFSTWANETGAARPDVIEACLAHREGDRIRASYNRARFDAERRELLRTWADYVSRPALALVAA